MLSRNGLKVLKAEDADELKEELNSGKQMNSQLAREGSSLDVTEDILLQMLDPKGEGDDATGYREKVELLGGTYDDGFCGEGRRAIQIAGHAG